VWDPYKLGRQEMAKIGVPLPEHRINVLSVGFLWNEIRWGDGSVHIRGVSYPVRSFFWCRKQGE